jgi:hypothetical protein
MTGHSFGQTLLLLTPTPIFQRSLPRKTFLLPREKKRQSTLPFPLNHISDLGGRRNTAQISNLKLPIALFPFFILQTTFLLQIPLHRLHTHSLQRSTNTLMSQTAVLNTPPRMIIRENNMSAGYRKKRWL